MKLQALKNGNLFGQNLRLWRSRRRLSQLELANLAHTTPRYISFIETGRSRPGRALVLRLAKCLELPLRERNTLLISAGLNPEYEERKIDDHKNHPYQRAMKSILNRHDPYPACAFNPLGKILMCNKSFEKLCPGLIDMTPEALIDAFYNDGQTRNMIANWTELAWNWIDRQRLEIARTNNQALAQLVARAQSHLHNVPRPPQSCDTCADVIAPQFKVDGQLIKTMVTVMRFESVQEITLSETRLELIFPIDEVGETFFNNLSKNTT